MNPFRIRVSPHKNGFAAHSSALHLYVVRSSAQEAAESVRSIALELLEERGSVPLSQMMIVSIVEPHCSAVVIQSVHQPFLHQRQENNLMRSGEPSGGSSAVTRTHGAHGEK